MSDAIPAADRVVGRSDNAESQQDTEARVRADLERSQRELVERSKYLADKAAGFPNPIPEDQVEIASDLL
jgi:hypothetical protein